MAGVPWTTTTELTTGTATVTIMQLITAAHRRNRISRITISGKGINNTDVPVTVELVDQSTAGTTGGNSNPVKVNPNDPETLGITAAITFSSTEPTTGNVRASVNVHPQSSQVLTFPAGVRDCFVGGSSAARLGIRALAPAQATTLRVTVEGEE